jgi:hypothetical protein
MTTSIDATFDGSVFRPSTPVALSPNTPVRLTIETLPVEMKQPQSFLRTARALNIQGPPDWAAQFDEYLDGAENDRAS